MRGESPDDRRRREFLLAGNESEPLWCEKNSETFVTRRDMAFDRKPRPPVEGAGPEFIEPGGSDMDDCAAGLLVVCRVGKLAVGDDCGRLWAWASCDSYGKELGGEPPSPPL